MKGFAYGLSFAFLPAMLLAGGVGHALGLRRFSTLIRDHGIVPHAWAWSVALAVTAFELGLGVALARALLVPASDASEAILAVGCGVAGLAFMLYLRRLLRQPVRALSCGCSLLASPLTTVSLAPSAGLLIVSAIGLGTALLHGAAAFWTPTGHLLQLLPVCWGVTLALLVLVLPAVIAPRMAMERL